jgi:Holliday junction resolvase RusA-like endonuclease
MSSVITPVKPETSPKRQIYTIVGQPTPLARPRFVSREKNGKVNVWDSQKQVKTGAGLQIRSQHRGPLLMKPLHMDIAFYFEAYDSHRHGTFNTMKPDIDNCIKFVLDVCNGLVFRDDAIVVSLSAVKKFDNYVRTEFSILEL